MKNVFSVPSSELQRYSTNTMDRNAGALQKSHDKPRYYCPNGLRVLVWCRQTTYGRFVDWKWIGYFTEQKTWKRICRLLQKSNVNTNRRNRLRFEEQIQIQTIIAATLRTLSPFRTPVGWRLGSLQVTPKLPLLPSKNNARDRQSRRGRVIN